jgi:hypothetical protein
MNKLRADNCTAVTALLDPPGPPVSSLLSTHRLAEGASNQVESAPSSSSSETDEMETEDTVSRHSPSESSSSELAALLSAPVLADASMPLPAMPPKLLETSLPLEDTTKSPSPEPLRVLRNRPTTSSSLDNKLPPNSSRKATPLLSGVRKKVTIQLSRKRPMSTSSSNSTSRSLEDRNASDTENQVSQVVVKKSRRSALPVASQRILRSGTSPGVPVRTLRSQDSNPRLSCQDRPVIHMRRKRSRSFTPTKRRK